VNRPAALQSAPAAAQRGLPGAEAWTHSPALPKYSKYYPGFLADAVAGKLLAQLWQDLSWQQRAIHLFGREVMQPRLICWQSDAEVRYSYSGLRLDPAPWHPELQQLRNRLSEDFGLEFNSVLANAYRDGQDSMGWHSDDEPELGPEPIIASVSLGAARAFRWREKSTGKSVGQSAGRAAERAAGRSAGMELQSGSLLLFGGEFQQHFQHSLPKTARPTGLRINLTYRLILPSPSSRLGCRDSLQALAWRP
jgi:alkylated DNA repair dioxygenase AlkB